MIRCTHTAAFFYSCDRCVCICICLSIHLCIDLYLCVYVYYLSKCSVVLVICAYWSILSLRLSENIFNPRGKKIRTPCRYVILGRNLFYDLTLWPITFISIFHYDELSETINAYACSGKWASKLKSITGMYVTLLHSWIGHVAAARVCANH